MLKRQLFNLEAADASWQPCLKEALTTLDSTYLEQLYSHTDWLPGPANIFNAFSLPVQQTNYVLFGESPYPRAASANGFAFWDAAVDQLWSPTGLSKTVNRATSLRNIIKMLLVAEGLLKPTHLTQPDIAEVDKHALVQTNAELFGHLLQEGFLLLNTTPVLRPLQVKKDAAAWQPFIGHILKFLWHHRPEAKLILFGNIANTIDKLIQHPQSAKFYAEHPYNISFIHNPSVIEFFQPFHLLYARKEDKVITSKLRSAQHAHIISRR